MGAQMNAIVSVGPQQQITAASNALEPQALTALPGQRYALTWQASGQTVLAQVFEQNGTPVSAPIEVSQSGNDVNRPDITTLSDGSFVVSYTMTFGFGTTAAIMAQRFDRDGQRLGPEIEIFQDPEDTSFDPEITALSDGGYVVTYGGLGRDGSAMSYHARVFEADGTPRSGDMQVNQTTESFQSFGDVTPLADGGFAVTWRSREVDGSFYATMLRLYDANGQARSDEIQVNQFWQGSQTDPKIATLDNGTLVITWESDDQDGSEEGIFARLMAPNGTPLGSEFQVNTDTFLYQVNPSVTALPDGGFLITWISSTSLGVNGAIKAQRFSETGTALGEEFLVTKTSSELNLYGHVSALSDGIVAISWQQRLSEDITGQVEIQRFQLPALGSEANDRLSGTQRADTLDGKGGNDKIFGGAGADRLSGGEGRDLLKGQGGADRLEGGAGNDRLFGDAQNDRLLGGAGHDTLKGGKGRDILNGQKGNDTLSGKGGKDVFVFNGGRDVITDFDSDLLQLDASLWGDRDLSKRKIMQFAETTKGDIVFEFSAKNTLTLSDFTDLDTLQAAITVI